MKRVVGRAVPLLFVVVTTAVALVVADKTRMSQHLLEPIVPYVEETEPCYEQAEYDISPYDNLFREICAEYSFDWRLLSAMADAESRFKADAESSLGAVGLMQVMPHVASGYGCSKEELLDVRRNIEVSAMLIRDVKRMLRPLSGVAPRDSLSFVLACYNAGFSRVADARALAEYYGEDNRLWSVVAEYLSLLSDPEFYDNEVVERGRFTGSRETIGYVSKVLASYDDICSRVAL